MRMRSGWMNMTTLHPSGARCETLLMRYTASRGRDREDYFGARMHARSLMRMYGRSLMRRWSCIDDHGTQRPEWSACAYGAGRYVRRGPLRNTLVRFASCDQRGVEGCNGCGALFRSVHVRRSSDLTPRVHITCTWKGTPRVCTHIYKDAHWHDHIEGSQFRSCRVIGANDPAHGTSAMMGGAGPGPVRSILRCASHRPGSGLRGARRCARPCAPSPTSGP
jgi:hypothetical protein